MKLTSVRLLFAAALLCGAPLRAQDIDAVAPTTLSEDSACIDCHADLTRGRSVHEPVETELCEACHRQSDEELHEFKPIKNVAKRCQMCHDVGSGELVHEPVSEGKCMECHEPHHSDAPSLLRHSPDATLCGQCHDSVPGEGHQAIHGPVAIGACVVCHEPHSTDSPRLLKAEPPDLCLSCHVDMQSRLDTAPVVHGPAATDCTLCHDAHSAETPFQLLRPGSSLCLECHTEIRDYLATASVDHGALTTDAECVNCHQPHHSAFPKLLDTSVDAICLSCHDSSVEASDGTSLPAMGAKLSESKFLHGPIKEGNCTACHEPHGSDHFRILRDDYPQVFYAPYETDAYALCFKCHDAKAFEVAETETLTGFRDGKRNLHYLHVNKDRKGRTCRACHDTHASNLPRHLRELIPFGSWEFSVNYQRSEQGGACFPGCHVERSYEH